MVKRQPRGTGPKICTREECDRPVRARGLCVTHYYAARASGEITPIYRVAGGALCDVAECNGARYSKGRCKRHYDEGRASGEFTPPCQVDGCQGGAVSRGYCRAHVARARRYGLDAEDLAVLDSISECDVCGRPAEHIDHDHKTGDVRGVLCRGCNTALGLVDDSRATLEALIHYLDRYEAARP